MKYYSSLTHSLILCLLLLMINANTTASSQSIVNTLPGYPGTLPFKLETGYIGVGENDEVQLFYYFIQSENDPQRDPLILWLTGGPGCSGFSGLIYEIGPLAFDLEAFDGSLPSLIINPYSWTKIANIIFIDSPVGTGFSYATTPQAYHSNDTNGCNRLYVAGDSYGGKITPMVALEIAKGNEAGLKPRMFLQGYIVGNAITDSIGGVNERVPFAHGMGLISDEYFELAKSSCNGEHANPDPNNKQCFYALQLVNQCISPINEEHIGEPSCHFMSPRHNVSQPAGKLFLEDPIDLVFLPKNERTFCRYYNYLISYVWANNETVREALHIREGTIGDWKRCNIKSLSYEQDVESVVKHHKLLSEKGFQALVYSGDHDMAISYISTLKWIRKLNFTLEQRWRPWFVDGQVAGYTLKYSSSLTYLTFATVKDAGHTAPEYKPKECFAMIKRWLSSYPL